MRVWTDSNGLRQGPVTGRCEHGNESSESLKAGNFLTYRATVSSQGLCSTELLSYHKPFLHVIFTVYTLQNLLISVFHAELKKNHILLKIASFIVW
jgi:hypothetical protein